MLWVYIFQRGSRQGENTAEAFSPNESESSTTKKGSVLAKNENAVEHPPVWPQMMRRKGEGVT